MGSSIKRYLRLQCGMFHQILALSMVLISPGEGSRENESILCLHHVSCCCSPLSLCICSVMGAHVYFLLACHALVSGLIWPLLSFSLNLCVFSPLHVRYQPFTPSPLCGLHVHTHVHRIHAYHVTLRVTVGELVTGAVRGRLLTLGQSRGASFFPGYRKQTS